MYCSVPVWFVVVVPLVCFLGVPFFVSFCALVCIIFGAAPLSVCPRVLVIPPPCGKMFSPCFFPVHLFLVGVFVRSLRCRFFFSPPHMCIAILCVLKMFGRTIICWWNRVVLLGTPCLSQPFRLFCLPEPFKTGKFLLVFPPHFWEFPRRICFSGFCP